MIELILVASVAFVAILLAYACAVFRGEDF